MRRSSTFLHACATGFYQGFQFVCYVAMGLLAIFIIFGFVWGLTWTRNDGPGVPKINSLTNVQKQQSTGSFKLQANESPHFMDVEVLVAHPTCSGTVRFTPQQRKTGVDIKHGAKVGHPGEVSDVSWTYLATTERVDHYHFVWTYPADVPSQQTVVKDVEYRGEPLTVFEVGKTKIILRPYTGQQQGNSDDVVSPGRSLPGKEEL